MSFIHAVSGESYEVDRINKKCLPKIWKGLPFIFNAKRHCLWSYMKIQELGDSIFEVRLWKFLTLQEKCLAFLLLSTLTTKYEMGVVGIGISINVNEKLRASFGDTYVEKLMFPHATNIWKFSPDRGPAILDVPGKICEKIDMLEKGEERTYSADYFPVELKTERVHSLILA